MEKHRNVAPNRISTQNFAPPFSCFEYIDSRYGEENSAIRRIFSLARSHSARTLMTEEIAPAGIISDENEEIKQYVPDYTMEGLHRISFWKSSFKEPDASVCRGQDCVGYAILKHDKASSKKCNRWHVFEAVFRKFPHKHNCIPSPMQYRVNLGGASVCLKGLLYAQQNQLNKSCAQVALRSVISRINQRDVSYRQINELAKPLSSSQQPFDPAKGLSTGQIRAILEGFGIRFRDFDYTQYDENEHEQHPYQKYVYAGVESGMGALLGFSLADPEIRGRLSHIIPFYGHTFNRDTWAPEAHLAYFSVGENFGYMPSENWTSSFLGHDDNFGPNFCVPRLFIPHEKVEYVVELLKPGILFGGAQAEVLALGFLYSVLHQRISPQNIWLKRLAYYAHPGTQLVVLRAIAVSRNKYIQHLSNEKDWGQNSENQQAIDVLSRRLPQVLWIVEISIPQLFPANERKLGEIVLNGGVEIGSSKNDRSHFLFARLPGLYFFESPDQRSKQDFMTVPSNLVSHLPVIKLQ